MDDAYYRDSYRLAEQAYAELGVDTEKALAVLAQVPLSLHCWQGDDVGGFETPDAVLSGGGIQVTGNYPGKARSPQELRQDLDQVWSLLPGSHRLNLHAIYGDFGGSFVDRDEIRPEHFVSWVEYAKERGLGIDFNPTLFSHPKAEAGFTLASKDAGIREFWIEHVRRSREIAAFIGRELGSPAVNNIWIPDGLKDYPSDRLGYRRILKESLDRLFAESYPKEHLLDAVETKLFGIGSEAYVVGSHEFYLSYAALHDIMVCLDLGHFHPTELIADKSSSILLFSPQLLLHVSRPMRWDSDHVVILNDDIRLLSEELVRCDALSRVHIGLDFFDGTLNRIGAWVTGARAVLKGLLQALLQPHERLKSYEEEGNFYGRLGLAEQLKSMPFGAVWDMYCLRSGTVPEERLLEEVFRYEADVLSKRS
jgi:L-rhamnose isomerase